MQTTAGGGRTRTSARRWPCGARRMWRSRAGYGPCRRAISVGGLVVVARRGSSCGGQRGQTDRTRSEAGLDGALEAGAVQVGGGKYQTMMASRASSRQLFSITMNPPWDAPRTLAIPYPPPPSPLLPSSPRSTPLLVALHRTRRVPPSHAPATLPRRGGRGPPHQQCHRRRAQGEPSYLHIWPC